MINWAKKLGTAVAVPNLCLFILLTFPAFSLHELLMEVRTG